MVELQHSTESTGAASDARPSRPTAQEQRAEVQRLTDELQRVTTLASKLLDVSTALSEARSVEEVSRVFLTKGVAVVEASRAALVSAQGDRLDLLGTVGFTAQLERELHEMTLASDIPVVHAMRLGTTIWIESGDEFREKYGNTSQGFTELADMQTYVATPLIHGGEIVGALALHFREAGALGAADRAFTLLLAQVTATALHRARSYDAAQELRRRAEVVADARAEVLGIVAHDLRNPLSLIVTSTELLQEEDLDAGRRRQVLEIAMRAGKQMNRLIEDLLDTVQLESGRLSLDLEDVDVATLFRQLDETFSPLAARRRITLNCVPPANGVRIRADAFRLNQVMSNLLGNAIKFTPEGGEVSYRAALAGNDVVFSVQDSGPGIPPEQIPHLFEHFWQARRNDKRGVGLGLTIAKGIIDAHGGRIWCESVPGAGSTFSFALPVSPSAATS
jgi:signal transduction histidine kinase